MLTVRLTHTASKQMYDSMGTFDDVIRMAVASYLLSGILARVHEHGDDIFMSSSSSLPVFMTLVGVHGRAWHCHKRGRCVGEPKFTNEKGDVSVTVLWCQQSVTARSTPSEMVCVCHYKSHALSLR